MKKIAIIIFTLISFFAVSQTNRKVIILDMTAYNQEAHFSRYYAVDQLLQSAGIPFDTTRNIDDISKYPVAIVASRILTGSMSAEVRDHFLKELELFVKRGGVLIHSGLKDPALYALSGVQSHTTNRNVYRINWNINTAPDLFRFVDDSLEKTISIGRPGKTIFHARTFQLSTGVSLGTYEDSSVALVSNTYNKGVVYTFGPDLRDIYMRNLNNFDVSAQRTYSNGFEPTTDVFMFIVRNIVAKHIPYNVFKHTAPSNCLSTILVTHDIDSRTGIDSLFYFSSFERDHNIPATYNVTTRYVHDRWMSDFYLDSGAHRKLQSVLDDGHILASHSVGHFPDFHKEELFPYALNGDDTASYKPFHASGKTSGGSLLSELVVSKNLLEHDFGVSVQSFRAGHLLYPDSLVMALAASGYKFNSTYSANDVLTNYPYRPFQVRSFSSSPSQDILEIPMTLSDVFKDEKISVDNAAAKGMLWSKITKKYHNNYSPITLLIHPNRGYKLTAFQAFYDEVKSISGLKFYPFEAFGEFWLHREDMQYYTRYKKRKNRLVVRIVDGYSADVSFWIADENLSSVIFRGENNKRINSFVPGISREGYTLYYNVNSQVLPQKAPLGNMKSITGEEGMPIIVQKDARLFESDQPQEDLMKAHVYPNPTQGVLNVQIVGGENLNVILTNNYGHIVAKKKLLNAELYQFDFRKSGLERGVYILYLEQAGGVVKTYKVVYSP